MWGDWYEVVKRKKTRKVKQARSNLLGTQGWTAVSARVFVFCFFSLFILREREERARAREGEIGRERTSRRGAERESQAGSVLRD